MKTSKQPTVLFLSLALGTLATIVVAGDSDPRQGLVAVQSEPAASNHEAMSADMDRDLELIRKLEARLLKLAPSSEENIEQTFRRFIAEAGTYGGSVQKVAQRYRAYVTSLRELKESCAELDGEDYEGTQFAQLVDDSRRQCAKDFAEMDVKARRYARRLDESTAFLGRLEKVTVRVKKQIDRIRLAMRVEELKQAVDEQLKTAQDTPLSHTPVIQ